jgi:hypothetical protein
MAQILETQTMDAFHRLSQLSSTLKERASSAWNSEVLEAELGRRWLMSRRRMVGISVAVALLMGFALAMGILWQFVICIAVVVLVVGATVLWWWMPKWQMRSVTTGDPKARADVEDNFRKTIGQALGGVAAALIVAGFTYLQFLQQQRATAEKKATAQEQLTAIRL